MNAKHLIAHFDRVSDDPSAIRRLRGLILDLAVQGRLVPQDGKEGTAASLLEQVTKEQQRQLEAGLIPRLPERRSLQEDGRGSVPDWWEIAELGWLTAKIGAGSTPRGGKRAYTDAGVPFIRSQNVYNDGLRMEGAAFIPEAVHERMSGTHVQPGDILLNITGASIGRCALVPPDLRAGNVSQHVSIIRLFVTDLREFVHLALISPFFQRRIQDVQVGVSREGLSARRLKEFPMPLPPLEEQERIVAKVGELMSLCDELERAQEARERQRDRLASAAQHRMVEDTAGPQGFKVSAGFYLERLPRLATRPEHISDLRRTVLELALRGRLVLQKVDTATTETRGLAMPTHSEEAGASDEPYEFPETWRWVRFGEVHDLVRGVTYTKSDVADELGPGYLPIVRANNIGLGLNFDDLVFVRAERVSAAQKLRRGDFLIALSSGSKNLVGKAAFVPEDYEIGFGGFCGAIRVKIPDLIPYVGVFLASPLYRHAIAGGSRGIGINNIKRSTLDELLFPLPPVEEQHRIVKKVEELMGVLDRLEEQLRHGSERRSRLLEAVLHDALNSAA